MPRAKQSRQTIEPNLLSRHRAPHHTRGPSDTRGGAAAEEVLQHLFMKKFLLSF
ncbi:hypothetical protein GF407_11165 [candidate division KSB1 bacterium]|nr:hypothetical protein [candidate division KSB1 bacterium]